ncbi:MAG: phospholipase [Pirellulaceae bacterium]
MSVTAETLRELHRIHRQLAELKSRLERGPRQVAVGETNVKNLEAALAEAKEVAKKTKMATDGKELQLKSREARIAETRVKLNTCSSNREYQALLEQIAADEQANSVLSDEILELLEKQTADQRDVVKAQENVHAGNADLERTRQRVDSERAGLESEVARLEEELKSSEKVLPADMRADYDRVVKAHGAEALAPLEGEYCGGCFQAVTVNMQSEVAMQKMVFCRTCGRLLYLPEQP